MWKPPIWLHRPAGVGLQNVFRAHGLQICHIGRIAKPEDRTWPLFITSGDLIADRRYEMARGYAADGDLAAAADLYAQAVELAPGFASAWFALGEAREALGDREAAREAFERARRGRPARIATARRCGWRGSARADPAKRRCTAMCARCSTSTRRASTARWWTFPIRRRRQLRGAVTQTRARASAPCSISAAAPGSRARRSALMSIGSSVSICRRR